MRFLERGQAPDGGAVHLLTRHLGEYRAKEIAFSSRWVDAQEALGLGLATKLVPDAEQARRAPSSRSTAISSHWLYL